MSQHLVFTTTSIRNVVIATKSDSIYYEVTTPEWERHLTRIRRLDPLTKQYSIVAEILNEDDNPAAVHMYGRELIPADDFLRRDEKAVGVFRGKDGRTYTWTVKDDHLELLRNDISEYHPLAVYHKHRRFMHVLRVSEHPYLEVDPIALDTLDSLIITFLLAERKRRLGK
ncbi:hypothetical protein PUNSTDRAFT_135465 [Punctularia strigosozonata HHB-11173 SS5]|uniref:uncharacterized protein n=1 Tax=Punctularia strigosozonata (strain HHB-11173) TaxID=741275 RepID=UPI00044181DF|nr:uncharacterized protein PUNSTDRAFT_135465 [Punctularia strigosozonata HHB-11173 SS5]EIN07948.1 hypothetical protein PUNSTDRAFT_135465 [Punctularia strigosozonata HHB-11173 SS5]